MNSIKEVRQSVKCYDNNILHLNYSIKQNNKNKIIMECFPI